LLQKEIETYTLQQPGIKLPAVRLEEDTYRGEYAGGGAPVRDVIVEVSDADDGSDDGWLDAGGWEAVDTPLPGQARGPAVEVELSVPGMEVEARAVTPPQSVEPSRETAARDTQPVVAGLPGVVWEGSMPPFPGLGYRHEPRLTGLPW
jgi:hypothetical protein